MYISPVGNMVVTHRHITAAAAITNYQNRPFPDQLSDMHVVFNKRWSMALNGNSSHSYRGSSQLPATQDHSVTCHQTQVYAPRLNPSQAGWYSIYLPWRDGRL